MEGPAERRLIWVGTNNAPEMAAYLFFLDRFPGIEAEVIRPDTYFPPHPKYGPRGSIGMLSPEQAGDALDNASRTPIDADAHLRGRWRELKAEGALLRVVERGELVSAPVDYFDRLLLAAATSQWTLHIRVVGTAMGAVFDESMSVRSEILFARLGALVDSGQLEARGDVRGWTEDGPRERALVRLPS